MDAERFELLTVKVTAQYQRGLITYSEWADEIAMITVEHLGLIGKDCNELIKGMTSDVRN